MVIEVVHGLRATSMSLNDRFSLLLAPAVTRPVRRRSVSGNFQKGSFRNQQFLEDFAFRSNQQPSRHAVTQRLGFPRGGLRRFGSETSLPGLQRSNSFGNLNHGYQNMQWRGSNGNLSRSASFGNLSTARRGRGARRYRARGGRHPRGAFRGVWGRVHRPGLRGARGARGARRGMRGRGRGGAHRQRPAPSREELDLQLDQYMASTKSALDKELDAYMKTAMDMEI